MNKKGYFFILDAFIASTIIAVSLVSIMNSDVAVGQRTNEYAQADAMTQFLLDTKLADLDNQYVKSLIADGTITNPRNTIMAQIDTFYYTAYYICNNASCRSININFSKTLLQNISEPIISQKYGYDYSIMDDSRNYSIYNRSGDTWSSSRFRVVTKRVSYAAINSTSVFKPHIVEFSLWIK
jgi:hypothetical protein